MGRKYTEEELLSCSKEMLVSLLLSMQDQVEKLNTNMEHLVEQIAVMNNQRFGRHTEKLSEIDNQLSIFDFNEIESIGEKLFVIEPEIDQVVPRRKKQPGKREEDLRDLPTTVITHDLTDEEKAALGKNYKKLPDEVYRRLKAIPRQLVVEEHHVAVYATVEDDVVKAKHPAYLLRNSLVTPSLAAAIMNEKFVNAVPLYRQEQEFKRNGISLSRQVMANWCIQCSEDYLKKVYIHLKNRLLSGKVIQADETPVEVTKDGRSAGKQSFMWVYRTGFFDTGHPVILFDYQKGRAHDAPEDFLSGYSGTVVCDGHSAYEALDRRHGELTFAGCWAHTRRRFADAVKVLKDKSTAEYTVAGHALKQIAAIYKLENELSTLSAEERREQRQLTVRPLTEAFFAWAKEQTDKVTVLPKGKTGEGLAYALHHEKLLTEFLQNGDVPMDNNATERAIRPFTIGRFNWRLIDTVTGARSSAVIYSLVETAKENGLNPRLYLEYLLTELPERRSDSDVSYLDDLLPWSAPVMEKCKVQTRTA